MKRLLSLLLTLAMTLSMLAGCASDGKSPSNSNDASKVENDADKADEDGPLVPYKDTVVLTIGKNVNANDTSLVDGDTVDNNAYTRYLKEKLNIEIETVWQASGDAYEQKVKLAVASGDIPDILATSYLSMKQAARSELLGDLTGLYDKYASPLVKKMYEGGNNMALESAKVDNKLFGIPDQPSQGNDVMVTWVRKDWLDKSGLPEPKNAEDIKTIALEFAKGDYDKNGKNDTIGLASLATYLNGGGFSNVYGSFNAYPNLWIEKDQKITYGSIQPEVKEGLALLSTWYKEGILDKEYSVRTDISEMVASGRSGIFFSPWWAPWNCLTDNIKNFPEAEWKAYGIPTDSEQKITYPITSVSSRYIIVSSECKNPEAAFKCVNLEVEHTRGSGYEDLDAKGEHPDYWPLRCPIGNATEIEDYSKSVRENLKRVDEITDEEKSEWDAWYTTVFESAVKDRTDMVNWGNGSCFTIGAQPYADNPVKKIYSQYFGVTDTMETPKWTYLTKLEKETFDKIVMGELPVSAFDKFTTDWLANGGQDIINEINKELGK